MEFAQIYTAQNFLAQREALITAAGKTASGIIRKGE
jgi:hypothetical protein